jgi:hypothetical protein
MTLATGFSMYFELKHAVGLSPRLARFFYNGMETPGKVLFHIVQNKTHDSEKTIRQAGGSKITIRQFFSRIYDYFAV